MVFEVGSRNTLSEISRMSFILLILSGPATEASWLCYYYAIQNGIACVVIPIEKLSFKIFVGLLLKTAGTLHRAVGDKGKILL